MTGRRIAYISFLVLIGTLHFFYEQYVSVYMLYFVLSLPVLSVLLSLPAMLLVKAQLLGKRETKQGVPTQLFLSLKEKYFLPLCALSFRVSWENLFTGESSQKTKYRLYGVTKEQYPLNIETQSCGVIRYTLSRG